MHFQCYSNSTQVLDMPALHKVRDAAWTNSLKRLTVQTPQSLQAAIGSSNMATLADTENVADYFDVLGGPSFKRSDFLQNVLA
jgi:hypothetical protein